MTEVSSTGNSYTQQTSGIDQSNQTQLQTDFSEMSVEDIMFLVLTARAEEQKKSIEAFAAQVQANTLKATNYNNLKAAIDQAAKSSGGVNPGDVTTTWENPDGSTETISAAEAFDRLGYSSDTTEKFQSVQADQAAVDADQAAVQKDQAKLQKDMQKYTLIDDRSGPDVSKSSSSPTSDPKVQADMAQLQADQDQLAADQAKLDSDKVSQNDLETLSANLANAHDKIEGDNQIAMAQLQKDMDDYQTTLQTCSSSTTSMAQLAQKIGGTVGQ